MGHLPDSSSLHEWPSRLSQFPGKAQFGQLSGKLLVGNQYASTHETRFIHILCAVQYVFCVLILQFL